MRLTVPSAGGSSAITTQDEGSTLSTTVTTINFVGSGVTASGAGATTTVTIPGAAGATDIIQTEIDFGSTFVWEGTFTITDVNVSGSSSIMASLAYVAPTGKELDELEFDAFHMSCAPGTGQFTLYVQSLWGSVAGKFKVNYLVG